MYNSVSTAGRSRRPSRDDVAKAAKTSGATVSRVLSGRDDVAISAKTRAAVLEAAEHLGYRPNANARALVTGKAGIIGFWMSLQYSKYRSQVLDKMRCNVSKADFALAITDVDEEFVTDQSFSRPLRIPCDGIIAFDNSASVDAFAREYDRLAPGTPYLSMGAYWSESRSYVGVDLRSGADAAMRHLIDRKHKKIAYLAPYDSDLISAGPRFESYSFEMKSQGLSPQIVSVNSAHFPDVFETLKYLESSGKMPSAILCMNDDLAISAVHALTKLGFSVGKDVDIIGFDGIEEGQYCATPITTVRQPIDDMCELAMKFIQKQLANPNEPLMQQILTPELVIRESTGK